MVTQFVRNTHCIVCGAAFSIARAGKLYCTNRCKQFRYNHRNEIDQALAKKGKGISPSPITFYIEDYSEYSRIQKCIKGIKNWIKREENGKR